MADFVMLMKQSDEQGWDVYIESLINKGCMRGGSSLGNGACCQKSTEDSPCTVTGYIRIEADNLDHAKSFLEGNPAYEAGRAVEILEEVMT